MKPFTGRFSLSPAAVGDDATTWQAPTKLRARGAALRRVPQLWFRMRLSDISCENWAAVRLSSRLINCSYASMSVFILPFGAEVVRVVNMRGLKFREDLLQLGMRRDYIGETGMGPKPSLYEVKQLILGFMSCVVPFSPYGGGYGLGQS